MKNPFYNAIALLCCGWLLAANTRGWSFWQSSANRSALHSTSYRYRPAISTGSSGGGWFSGGGFHK